MQRLLIPGFLVAAVMIMMLAGSQSDIAAQGSPLCFSNSSACTIDVSYRLVNQNNFISVGKIPPGEEECFNSGGTVAEIKVANSNPITAPAVGMSVATGLNCPTEIYRAGGPVNTFVFF